MRKLTARGVMGDDPTRRWAGGLVAGLASAVLLSACATGEGMFLTGSDGPSDAAAFDDSEFGDEPSDDAFASSANAILAASGNVRLPYAGNSAANAAPSLGGTLAGLTAPASVNVQLGASVAGLLAGTAAALNLNPGAGQAGVSASLSGPLPAGANVQLAAPLSGARAATVGLIAPPGSPATGASTTVTHLYGAVMQLTSPAGGQTAAPALAAVPSSQALGALAGRLTQPGR